MKNKSNSTNYIWASVVVNEFQRQGLKYVCISPGSRSTPLALAFYNNKNIEIVTHFDERGAAFFALGLAKATGKPAAILCTSGTAAANYYPAVIEAKYSETPLLILTADRPPELRESGANQTINQINLYNENVLWFLDVLTPVSEIDTPIEYLQSVAVRAYHNSYLDKRGPVHLNFPFRKPLEPDDLDIQLDLVGIPEINKFRVSKGKLSISDDDIKIVSNKIQESKNGIIICGPNCQGGDFPENVLELAKSTGYPIIADALSGVRFGPHVDIPNENILGGYENYIGSEKFANISDPDLIIQFGDMPISQSLNQWLGSLIHSQKIQIRSSMNWKGENYITHEVILGDPDLLCRGIIHSLQQINHQIKDMEWRANLLELEQNTWGVLTKYMDNKYFEAFALIEIVNSEIISGPLFVGNSLPVRHLDQFCQPNQKDIKIFTNRGASGIDGVIASAFGVAKAEKLPTTLVLGDISFLHDINSLLLYSQLEIKITIVVINNNGGGIFQRLPISGFGNIHDELFNMPHGLDFENISNFAGFKYIKVKDRVSYSEAVRYARTDNESWIVELESDSIEFERLRLEFQDQVNANVNEEIIKIEEMDLNG